MGYRPGGGLAHHRCEAGAAPLWNHDAVGPGALRRTDDGPQVVGVREFVANHQQRRLSLVRRRLENILHRGVFPDRGQGDDALMGMGAAHGVQLPPVGLYHHRSGGASLGSDVPQCPVRLALLEVNFVDCHAGSQRLNDGVPALNHPVSLGKSVVVHIWFPPGRRGSGPKILSILF